MYVMRILLTFLSAACFCTGYGQDSVSGRVINEAGQPVPFASIYSSKTNTNGTAADINGNFKLISVFNRDTLICTHTNYQTKKEEVFGNNNIVFRLIRKPPALTQIALSGESRAIAIKQAVKFEIKDNLSNKEDDKVLFGKVEIPAAFGKESDIFKRYSEKTDRLSRYLAKNIIFPDSTSIRFNATGEFEGILTVRFTVDKTGKATNAVVIKGLNEAVDKVVLDVIAGMPLWEPAMQNGRTVDSEQEISVYFLVQQKIYKN